MPPGMLELLEYTTDHTDLNATLMYQLMKASGWNASSKILLQTSGSSMMRSPAHPMEDIFRQDGLALDNRRVTLFVPTDDAVLARETDRLLNPLWTRHLQNMIANIMLPQAYSKEQLAKLARLDESLGFAQVETIGGTFLDVAIVSTGLSVGGGQFKEVSLEGTDG